MSDLSFEEYKAKQFDDEMYGLTKKSRGMKKYDELELQFIKNLYLEKENREPTEAEIEEQKTELLKIKYLVESWMDEYFDKVDAEYALEKEKATKKARKSRKTAEPNS